VKKSKKKKPKKRAAVQAKPQREGLNPRQEVFVQEFLIDHNATRAAISAGYSERTAYSIGSENLKKPEIQSRIRELLAERSKELKTTAETLEADFRQNKALALGLGQISAANRADELRGKLSGQFEERIDVKIRRHPEPRLLIVRCLDAEGNTIPLREIRFDLRAHLAFPGSKLDRLPDDLKKKYGSVRMVDVSDTGPEGSDWVLEDPERGVSVKKYADDFQEPTPGEYKALALRLPKGTPANDVEPED